MGKSNSSLIQKIEQDLLAIDKDILIFKKTAIELDAKLNNKLQITADELKNLLTNCYRMLLQLEANNSLTVAEMVLLNDIDKLDDALVISKN